MRCLFLAPMKPPDHPVPSGDRMIARLWMRALTRIGYEVELASSLRTYHHAENPDDIIQLDRQGAAEIERILTESRDRQDVALVFCYHNYYKAPDLIGPELARALSIAYVAAEGSLAPKRLLGPYAAGENRARSGLAMARVLLCATHQDRPALEAALGPGQILVDLPAFVDPADWPEAGLKRPGTGGKLRLITVAMMREGNKMESYEMLAEALAVLDHHSWQLDIFGDGPMRPRVEAAFARFGNRVHFHGAQASQTVGLAYAASDLFVWPAVREPYGLVFLEAQLHGLPCLAGAFGGVADAVAPPPSGQLVAECTGERFAAALATMMFDRARLREMGAMARAFILAERSLDSATIRLRDTFEGAGIPLPRDKRI